MDDDIDLEGLLAPVEGAPTPVGEDLRLAVDASNFFLLKDLRAEARTSEREAAASPEAETPVLDAGARKWAELAELAVRLLRTQTKDLEIASWLCEALTRLQGFAGLAAGLELTLALLERYWEDGVYPSEDEDGVETRIAPVGGLLGLSGAAALLQPVKLLPISDRDKDVALWSLEAALAPLPGGGGEDGEARERLVARRAERLEAVRQAVARSTPDFLRATYASISSALETLEGLAAASDRVAGTGRFGLQVAEPLRNILDFYKEQVPALFAAPATGAGAPGDGVAVAGAVGGQAGGGAPGAGGIAGREDAYAAVLRIADWFEAAEPQSLTARGLRDVVRRGRLPLEQLLAELLPDGEQRVLFLQRAGVRAAEEAQETY